MESFDLEDMVPGTKTTNTIKNQIFEINNIHFTWKFEIHFIASTVNEV